VLDETASDDQTEPRAITPLPIADRRHLDVLTDAIGIMQHATGSRPDPAHGYCTDDVARALQVDLLQARVLGWPAVAERVWSNLRFISEAYDDLSGRFRNFRAIDGTWLPGTPSQDSQGRAMHALGDAIAQAPDARLVRFASTLFEEGLVQAQRVTALRAEASILLACDAAIGVVRSAEIARVHRLFAGRLRTSLASSSEPGWPWPEPILTYENALPARALITAGHRYRSRPMVDSGVRSLDWLVEIQTVDGHLSPIGNGWWPRMGTRAKYDQQPIEPTSLLLAAEAAFVATGDERHRETMETAFAWFLGANDRGVPVADPAHGACFDGLTARGVNKNQGAESTLMWLTAVEHMRAVRAPVTEPVTAPAPDEERELATALT
jgi:hypothetical protein